MRKKLILASASVCLAALVLTAGCDRSPNAQTSRAQTIRSEASADAGEDYIPLLVPYQGLMVGIIDGSARQIFHHAAAATPLDDGDWTAAGLAAVNIIATTTLLSMKGSGPNDAHRHADPEWRALVEDLQNASVFVAISIQRRDRQALNHMSDLLATSCQSCHDKFRVSLPPDTSRFALR